MVIGRVVVVAGYFAHSQETVKNVPWTFEKKNENCKKLQQQKNEQHRQ